MSLSRFRTSRTRRRMPSPTAGSPCSRRRMVILETPTRRAISVSGTRRLSRARRRRSPKAWARRLEPGNGRRAGLLMSHSLVISDVCVNSMRHSIERGVWRRMVLLALQTARILGPGPNPASWAPSTAVSSSASCSAERGQAPSRPRSTSKARPKRGNRAICSVPRSNRRAATERSLRHARPRS